MPHISSFGTEQGLLRLLRTRPHRKYQSVVHNSLLRKHQFVLVPKLPLLGRIWHGAFYMVEDGAKRHRITRGRLSAELAPSSIMKNAPCHIPLKHRNIAWCFSRHSDRREDLAQGDLPCRVQGLGMVRGRGSLTRQKWPHMACTLHLRAARNQNMGESPSKVIMQRRNKASS